MATEQGNVVLSKEDGIAIIILDRPEKLNALSLAMTDDIVRAIEQVRDDDDVRIILIRGAGRAFCSGIDVRGLGERAHLTAVESAKWMTKAPFLRVVPLLRSIGKPTIAAVHGVALGAGLALAIGCDIRIASDNASFGMTYAKLGLVPDMGVTIVLPQIIGVSRACELLFMGERIDAKEAERIGLVSHVVPDAELMPYAMALARKLANGAPMAIAFIKQAVYRGLNNDLDSHIEQEVYLLSLCRETQDHQEAVKAILEKREPHFTGS